MAKGKKSKKKPKKAKRVESTLNEATPPVLKEEEESEESPLAVAVDAKPAVSETQTKPEPKRADPEPVAATPAPAVRKRLTREERRAKRKAEAAGERQELQPVEDAGSGGALLFLGVIFALLIGAIIVAMVTR